MERLRYYTEQEMDAALRKAQFFRIFKFGNETVETAFYDRQKALIDKLEKLMEAKFGKDVFVSDHLWPNESLKMEIGEKTLSDSLLNTVFQFLNSEAKQYCICLSVSRDLHVSPGPYLGRVYVSLNEVSVESSLKEIFVR